MLLYKQLDSGFVDYLVRGFEPHSPPENSGNTLRYRRCFLCVGECPGENPFLRGPREFLILGESAAQGENVLQGQRPQSREP